MVLNASDTMVLKKNHTFCENQIKVLANHEIGVHLVTTHNGKSQPLKVFSNGFVNNTETQEGLAVFSEADSLIKGYSFVDTFDLLHNQYKVSKDSAWQISLRVHRGGGFTKDFLYLTGLKKVYDYYRNDGDLSLLLTGKVTIESLPMIKKMMDLGLAIPSKHITDSYTENLNTNTKLDFILRNLK